MSSTSCKVVFRLWVCFDYPEVENIEVVRSSGFKAFSCVCRVHRMVRGEGEVCRRWRGGDMGFRVFRVYYLAASGR